MNLCYRTGKLLANVFMRTFGSIEIRGVENIPSSGGFIVTANHLSTLDPPLLTVALNRTLFFLGKKELFVNRIVAYILRSVHVYPVSRSARDANAVLWAISLLEEAKVLCLFPEGARGDGVLMKGEVGAAYIAVKCNVKILPVGITGTNNLNSFLRVFFPFRKIKISIGLPYVLPEQKTTISRVALEEMTSQLMRKIAALLPTQYHGIYSPDEVKAERE